MDIVKLLLYFAFTMAEYLCILWGLKIEVKKHRFIGYGLIATVALWFFFGTDIAGGEGYYGTRVAFATVVFMIDKKKILDKIESAFLTALMKDCLLLAVETLIAEKIQNIGQDNLGRILYYAAELSLIIVLGLILRFALKHISTKKISKFGNLLDYIIVIGCFDIFTCLWWAYREIMKGNYTDLSDKLYTSFAAISLLLLEINILYKKWLTGQVQMYAKAEHELSETQKHYYQSLLDKEADTKKYRHDMNNHMICIKSLLDEGNYDELQKYIDKLYDQTNFLVSKGYKTGNSILDALTNYYADNIGKDIDFSVKGNIGKAMNIDETSLSSIYSNMLVNAIEAQKHIEGQQEKYIYVTLKEGDKFAQLVVRNSMENERIEDIANIETTKIDKDNHGFGIANIKKNVAEHNGKLVIEAEDYEFSVKATIPLVGA